VTGEAWSLCVNLKLFNISGSLLSLALILASLYAYHVVTRLAALARAIVDAAMTERYIVHILAIAAHDLVDYDVTVFQLNTKADIGLLCGCSGLIH
jgi:hypothetical protein